MSPGDSSSPPSSPTSSPTRPLINSSRQKGLVQNTPSDSVPGPIRPSSAVQNTTAIPMAPRVQPNTPAILPSRPKPPCALNRRSTSPSNQREHAFSELNRNHACLNLSKMSSSLANIPSHATTSTPEADPVDLRRRRYTLPQAHRLEIEPRSTYPSLTSAANVLARSNVVPMGMPFHTSSLGDGSRSSASPFPSLREVDEGSEDDSEEGDDDDSDWGDEDDRGGRFSLKRSLSGSTTLTGTTATSSSSRSKFFL